MAIETTCLICRSVSSKAINPAITLHHPVFIEIALKSLIFDKRVIFTIRQFKFVI